MAQSKNPESSKESQKHQNKLIQAEILELRNGLKNLRQFLHGCQNSINAETKKLEKECLKKIQSLENERSSIELKLCQVKEENRILEKNASDNEATIRNLDTEVNKLKVQRLELHPQVNSLESKLKVQCEQNTRLEKEMEERRVRCFELENKLASNKAYMHEEKKVLCEMVEEQKSMKAYNCDLELQFAEKQAFEDALQEHIIELESICSILRDQLDEQQKYFLQKEISIKKDAANQYHAAVNENKRLSTEMEKIKLEMEETKTNLEQQNLLCEKLKERNLQKDEKIKDLEENVKELQENIKTENSTVEMLNKKNNELAVQLAKVQSDVRHIQDKFAENSINNNHSVDRKALKEIENTVQQYFDEQRKNKDQFNSSVLSENSKKVAEYQNLLAEERKKRLSAEIQVENMRVELGKAKVESAIQRSHFISRKSKRSKSCLLPRFGALSNIQNGKDNPALPNMDKLEFSTPSTNGTDHPSPDRMGVGDGKSSLHQEALPRGISNDKNLNLCKGSTMPNIPNIREVVTVTDNFKVQSSETLSIDGDGASSISSTEFLVSPRATLKVEEAKRRALAMLSGMNL